MKQSFSAIIAGRVQGVFYRDFVVARAGELGLTGETENLPDATVRVEAEGGRAELESLLRSLERGPRGAAVQSVSISWKPYSGTYKGFTIRFS